MPEQAAARAFGAQRVTQAAGQAGEPIIAVEGLAKVYTTPKGAVAALRDVSFDAQPGEFLSVLGPSGCGKSTMLMIVAGLRERTAGSVRINGQEVRGPQDDIGIVFQRDVLLDWRNVLDNVLLQIECRKLPKDQYRDEALRLLRSVGLAGFERSAPYELSGGMRQRVSICRAFIHDPTLLLMDEPFGALDALTREQMMLDLQKLWMERNKTVMFITHSIPEAVFLSDRVLVMGQRPGTVELDLHIELPRPRAMNVSATPEYNAYVQQIRDTFEAKGVFHGG